VGVSHMKDVQKEHIVIRARSLYIYKLMDTKPFHQSYTVVKPYAQYEDGEYAEFSVEIEPNNEFYGRILQMGAGLEIISPNSVRNEIAQRVHNLADLYPM
ncbi:MAG: WYL domain-containing protein, partial [Bacteroidaceae bacterium]|nr:WYL domain-containing protein [Bacteroidaceae bacterium]